MTLSFSHKIVDKSSSVCWGLPCREGLFPYTCTHEVQAVGPLTLGPSLFWPPAEHSVFSHNMKESIQKVQDFRTRGQPSCLLSSKTFRFEVIMKESNCDWFSFKHCAILIRLHLAHAVWNRHNEAGLYQRDSTLCIVQFGFVFLWPACGNLPFSEQ